MKKILQVSIAVLIFASCESPKQVLNLQLKQGEKYYQTISSDMSIKQTVQGQEMDVNMTLSAKLAYLVNEVVDSIYGMDVSYESLSMKMTYPEGSMEFSSEKEDEDDMLSKVLGMIKNKTFKIKMDKQGKIVEVAEIGDLFTKIFEEEEMIPEGQKEQLRAQLEQTYGEEAFRSNLEMGTAIFPEGPVAVGDTWNSSTKSNASMPIYVETTYKLVEVGEDYYNITGESIIDTKGEEVANPVLGALMKFDLKGTMQSDIKISKETGWLTEASITQKIEGQSEIPEMPQLPGGMIIPMKLESKITLTGK